MNQHDPALAGIFVCRDWSIVVGLLVLGTYGENKPKVKEK